MSVFKQFEEKDSLLERSVTDYKNMFKDNMFESKSISGWNVEYDEFSQFSDVHGNMSFLNGGKFSVGYADESGSRSDVMLWNMIMSSIMATYNSEEKRYDFEVNNQRISKAIAVSLNPDYLNQGLSDNFITAWSDESFSEPDGNGNFDLINTMVLAPYKINDGFSDETFNSSGITPAWELRTTSSNEFVTIGSGNDSLSIDWSKGTVSGIYGIVFPNLGLVLLFPELIDNTDYNFIQNITSTSNAVDIIQWFGGFTNKIVDKFVYFFRLRNDEFNNSNNPTAYELRDGEIKRLKTLDPERTGQRMTFITRIGYFNEWNECLATGFFEYPLQKTSFDENIIVSEIDI